MYDVALSVLSCVRANTDVHVAWVVEGEHATGSESVAYTPGGGRMGSLLGGAFDHALVEALPRVGDLGGLVSVPVGPVEALVTGISEGSTLTVALLPGQALPLETWQLFAERQPVAFTLDRDGDRFTAATPIEPGATGMDLAADRLTASFQAIPHVVIAGGGPIADALSAAFGFIAWQASVLPEVGAATGLMATLSTKDAVVVMGHDVEISGRALQGAVGSKAGYIASIGSNEMQELRRQWIEYRGASWDDRVHGPAGLPIGADNPAEIAISIVAEAVAFLRLGRNAIQ